MTPPIRYVGLDIHKHYVMVGAVDQSQQTVLPPRKVAMAELQGWAEKYLRPTDHIVLEATTNAWYVHDLLAPRVSGCWLPTRPRSNSSPRPWSKPTKRTP